MPETWLGSPERESGEGIGAKKDVVSEKDLEEKRRWWKFLMREALEDGRISQFYIACPDDQFDGIVSYFNESFQAELVRPSVELDAESGAGNILDKLHALLRAHPVREQKGKQKDLLVTVRGFTQLFEYWYRRNARSGRVGHDFNQEIAEHYRGDKPLTLPPKSRLIIITHISYLPESIEDGTLISLQALGAAATSHFKEDIIEVDPPPALRKLEVRI